MPLKRYPFPKGVANLAGRRREGGAIDDVGGFFHPARSRGSPRAVEGPALAPGDYYQGPRERDPTSGNSVKRGPAAHGKTRTRVHPPMKKQAIDQVIPASEKSEFPAVIQHPLPRHAAGKMW